MEIKTILNEVINFVISNSAIIVSWVGAIVSGVFALFQIRYKAKIDTEFGTILEQKKMEFQKSLHSYGNFTEKRNQIYRELYENSQKAFGVFPCVSGPVNYPIFDEDKNKNLEVLKSYLPDLDDSKEYNKNVSYDCFVRLFIRDQNMDRLYNNFRLLNELYFSDEVDKISKQIYKDMIELENHTYSYMKYSRDRNDFQEIYKGYKKAYDSLNENIEQLKKQLKQELSDKVHTI